MSRVNHVKLTCPEVQGLKDPFTGRDLVVYAHVCDGVVTYSAPDATSLRVPQLTVDRLMKRASMRDGLVGAADEDERMKNPYDGEPSCLSPTMTDGIFSPADSIRRSDVSTSRCS